MPLFFVWARELTQFEVFWVTRTGTWIAYQTCAHSRLRIWRNEARTARARDPRSAGWFSAPAWVREWKQVHHEQPILRVHGEAGAGSGCRGAITRSRGRSLYMKLTRNLHLFQAVH